MDPFEQVLYRKMMEYLSPYNSSKIKNPLYLELKKQAEECEKYKKHKQEQSKFILKQLGQKDPTSSLFSYNTQDHTSSLSQKKKYYYPVPNTSHSRSNSAFSSISHIGSISQHIPKLHLGRMESEQLTTSKKMSQKRQIQLKEILPKNNSLKLERNNSQPNLVNDSNENYKQTMLIVYEEPVQHVWSELKFKGKLCEGRSFSPAVIYKGIFYFYGGYDAIKGVYKDFISIRLSEDEPSSFNSVDLTPESATNSPGRLCRHGAVLRNDSMIIFGGKSSSLQSTNGMYAFSFESMQFQKIKPILKLPSKQNCMMPTIDSHSLNYDQSEDRLVVFGGYLGEMFHFSNKIFTFQFSSGEWEEVEPVDTLHLPKPRGSHGACLHDNQLFVFGGTDGETVLEDFWYFDFKSKSWNLIIPEKGGISPGPRSGISLVDYEGYFFVFGGFKSLINERNDLVIFNILTKKWVYRSERKVIFENKQNQQQLSPVSLSPKKSFRFNAPQSSTSLLSDTQLKSGRDPSPLSRAQSPLKQNKSPQKTKLFLPLLYRDEVSEIIKKRQIGKNKLNSERKMQLLRQFEVPEETRIKLLQPIPVLQQMKKSLNMLSSCNLSKKYDEINQNQLKEQNLVNTDAKIRGKHPGARDGYLWACFKDKLIIFGGDRHRMSLNDTYELDLPLMVNYIKNLKNI